MDAGKLVLRPQHLDLGDVLRTYRKVLVPEMNLGQLAKLVRAEFLVDAQRFNKVQCQPFTAAELAAAITAHLSVGVPSGTAGSGGVTQGISS